MPAVKLDDGSSPGSSPDGTGGNVADASAAHRKIPKVSPGAYIFQRPFLRGLYSEGLMYGWKFAFQNRLG